MEIAANLRPYEYKGNKYLTLQGCKVKHMGKWVDGVIYFRTEDRFTDSRQLYVRTWADFYKNFKEL